LRGADASLERCVEGILNQDYPHYEVVIIVDNVNDPAWEATQRIVSRPENSHVRMEALTAPRTGCSLKCSSLVQAIDSLDDTYKVVALLDADTSPYPGWLKDLVSPLAENSIGATTGARWHMPADPTWGSIVRYQWGLAAVLTSNALAIGWGGSMAIKRDVFRRAGLREKWSSAYCEDSMMHDALRPLGLRLRYLPRLVMVNRESCSLNGFFEWCTRQMLTTRLYHKAWPLIVAHTMFSVLVSVCAIALAIAAVFVREWSVMAWIAVSLGIFLVLHWLGMLAVEKSAERLVVNRGESASWLGWKALWRTFLCVPLTQIVYFIVVLKTMWVRRVCWRGIWYEIAGPWDVRMDSYRPFNDKTSHTT